MGTQDRLIVDWTKHIPCSRDFVVPTQVRSTFLDYTTFTLATRLGRLAADPANPGPTDYTDLEGGIYYRTTNQRIYYRDALVWRPLGTGDGDVIFDPLGTAQFDDGVARWSVTTREIQGSIASLDDNGNFSTPGSYQSRPTLSTDTAFISRPAGLSQEPRYYVQQDGKTFWGPGGTLGAPGAQVDTDLERLGINELGSTRSDAKFSLTAGDSRIKAQRHLGGLGNAQGNSNYRCPMVVDKLARFASPEYAAGAGGSSDVFVHNIPAKALQDGDTLDIDVYFQTGSGATAKRIDVLLNTTPNITISLPIAGGALYAGWAKITLIRTNQTTAVLTGIGLHGTSVLLTAPLGNTAFNNSGDWEANSYQIVVKAVIVGDVAISPADELIIEGGRLTYYNY
jgi:hypothetical protein